MIHCAYRETTEHIHILSLGVLRQHGSSPNSCDDACHKLLEVTSCKWKHRSYEIIICHSWYYGLSVVLCCVNTDWQAALRSAWGNMKGNCHFSVLKIKNCLVSSVLMCQSMIFFSLSSSLSLCLWIYQLFYKQKKKSSSVPLNATLMTYSNYIWINVLIGKADLAQTLCKTRTKTEFGSNMIQTSWERSNKRLGKFEHSKNTCLVHTGHKYHEHDICCRCENHKKTSMYLL